MLSFEDEESDEPKKRLSKNPNVDTSFLPDRSREEEDRQQREALRKEWLAEQERIKDEVIEITYSFWDGSGHRKAVECKKGDDIAAFLSKCRAQFPELRGTSIDNLMYIKVSNRAEFLLTSRKTSSYHMYVLSETPLKPALYLLRLYRQRSSWQVGPTFQL